MADQKKPNIVMIMADDVGTWNLSAYHRVSVRVRLPLSRWLDPLHLVSGS
ncbi:MAG: hypothetical protein QOC76_4580 [Mycobacterium sp.]|jgi:arylsulfatase A-like enzyme|nr:hypothetical protein [Mycobacterium sp.]